MSWVPDSTQVSLLFPLGNAFCMEKVIISRSSYLPKLQVYIRSAMLRLPRKVAFQHHQMLPLPPKVTLQHHQSVFVPATKSHSTICETNHMKRHLQGGRFEHDSSMNWQVISRPLSPRLLFTLCGRRIMEKE